MSSQAIESLLQVYVDHIRKLYKDSDTVITYEYHTSYSYRDVKTWSETCLLEKCSIHDLQYMLLDNKISIQDLKLELSNKEQQIYNIIIKMSYYNYSIAVELYNYSLYLNDNDKLIIRTNILNRFDGWSSFFSDERLINKLQLTSEEKLRLFNAAIFKERSIVPILTNYYTELTDDIKNQILSLLMIYSYDAENCLLCDVPADFQLQIFNRVFTTEKYAELFDKLCKHHINNKIRELLFNYLINNNYDFSFFDMFLDYLNETELFLVCNKFYKDIFKNTSSFNSFFSYCIKFNKYLRKNERMILIQKLKARTRINKCHIAKQKITFTPDELDIINSIILRDKL